MGGTWSLVHPVQLLQHRSLRLQAGPGGLAQTWGAGVWPHGIDGDLATVLVILAVLQAAALGAHVPAAVQGAGEALRAPTDPIGGEGGRVGYQGVVAHFGDPGRWPRVTEVALVPPALAAAQPVQPLPGQPLDVIAVLQVMDALGRAACPCLRPAVMGTPVGRAGGTRQPPQCSLILVHGLDELLPAPQQLLGPLGELLVLRLLADVVDELPKSGFLQPERDDDTLLGQGHPMKRELRQKWGEGPHVSEMTPLAPKPLASQTQNLRGFWVPCDI